MAKKPEEPQLAPKPGMQLPEVYSNVAKINFNAFEFEMTCGAVSANYDGVKPLINIRMNPYFAKQLAELLAERVKAYEDNVGKIGESKK